MSEPARIQGLPAQIAGDCRVLVLGSMPGVASLQAARYYAHPRNRFWPLMSQLLGIDATAQYPARLAQLQARGVGLWDVIGECVRPGSLDASIDRTSVMPNDLPGRIATLADLRAVACNGAEAHRLWLRWIAPRLPAELRELPVLALPSTSPANAAFGLERLAEAWRPLRGALSPGP
ncbi:DNA-deoxyinosine glycosylase [Stenotrophomonas panacihumi]|uniref:DNA-deoxyinosine glycosylase n=1 Tax=Stenotrophomonas panacihumi TaxID=676599 RepID=A0A0R0ASW9_9GAMM|nr:DNA-deoxyinosine glycosylase [Stenotrophomonas panacihumi]KRG43672.1 DNA-deoxyinosine glycosylase [Stenotrophomonas panacihumi]PTN55420.1 DNA-deoxyinosine glycosylase [Stenotrophomonas panacihumi]